MRVWLLIPLLAACATDSAPPPVVERGARQEMNVRTAPVQRRELSRRLHTVGRVEVGDDQVSVVNLRFSGWVERVRVHTTGEAVKRGQVLFEIYAPELVAAQEEYLAALGTEGPDSPFARAARRKLELWDVSSTDIEAIERDGEVRRTVPVRAPASGFVLAKDVVEGARVQSGQDLYRIGNLDKIWVTAEIWELDAPWVEVGQPAWMELAYQQGHVLDGTVSYVYPTLDPETGSLTVRLEFANPGVRLKPGMSASVAIQHRTRQDVLVVPEEAIVHEGMRRHVLVDLGEGRFERRPVTTGLAGDGGGVEVLSGLAEGERVVVGGQGSIVAEPAPEPADGTAETP